MDGRRIFLQTVDEAGKFLEEEKNKRARLEEENRKPACDGTVSPHGMTVFAHFLFKVKVHFRKLCSDTLPGRVLEEVM